MPNIRKGVSIALVVLICVVAGAWILSHRHIIAARVWHWRHGDFATAGNYRVPVPAEWNVVVEENGTLVLSDTVGGGIITLSSSHSALHISNLSQLNTWRELAEEHFRKEGVQSQAHAFQISGTDGVCV
jgi:hypothetical protein